MKIKDIITQVNKSKEFKDKIYIGDIAREFDINNASDYSDQDRLTSYFFGGWYCTDSYVGYKVYFFDNEPVAVSSQTGRKMTEDIEWISKDAYKKVKEYVLTFAVEEEDSIQLANMDEEIGESYKISFNGQLFDYHKDIPLFNGEKVKIIEFEKVKPNTYDITTKVKIQKKDNAEEWVGVEQLDFPFNTTVSELVK